MSGALPPGYTSPPPPGAGGPAPLQLPNAGAWQLASWGSRAGAQLIDGLIIVGVAFVLLVPAGLLGIFGVDTSSELGLLAIIGAVLLSILVGLVVAAIYAPVMLATTDGRTLGRMAVGIRVVRADGRPMSFGRALLREIVVKGAIWLVAGATFGIVWLVDVLWPLWDEENRALHDFPCGTRTVRG